MSGKKNINQVNAVIATANKQIKTSIEEIKDGIRLKEERINLTSENCNKISSLDKERQAASGDGSFKTNFKMEFEGQIDETLAKFISICQTVEAIKKEIQVSKEQTGIMEQNCIFLPFPATKTFKDAELEVLPKLSSCLGTLPASINNQLELQKKIDQLPSPESMLNDIELFLLGGLKYMVQSIADDEL